MISIPVSDDPFFKQFTSIDGKDYLLTFTYNQRELCYYLTIGTEATEDIVRGLKLVCSWPLLLGHRDERLPKGTLMVVSNTTDSTTPDLGELGVGKRCELMYFSVGDL